MRSSYIYRMEDDAHRVEGGEIQTLEDANMLKVFQLRWALQNYLLMFPVYPKVF